MITITSCEVEWAGKRVEFINPSNTSHICYGCGQIVKTDISERIHICPYCSLTLNRIMQLLTFLYWDYNFFGIPIGARQFSEGRSHSNFNERYGDNMGRQFKYIAFGIALVILSVITYYFHYLIFRDYHHIFIYLLGDIAFVPIEVLLVSMIIHHFLNEMDKRNKLEKLNMIIGSFFSEVGTKLLALISNADPELDSVRKYIIIRDNWTDKEFEKIIKYLNNYEYNIDIKKLDLEDLRTFMIDKRNFLVLLLENPTMLEHEVFTELLRAVFHLAEELEFRDDFAPLPDTDINHLSIDIKRVYILLAIEWVSYMRYMKSNYPYLFSLSMRTNPFDKDASPIVD